MVATASLPTVGSVLIADDIDRKCVEILQNNNIKVTVQTKMSKQQLAEEIAKVDAVIVRSATKITKEVLDAGKGQLKVIGRAGTGVDNIDVAAATEHGMLVLNTPAGNSLSAAELTCTMIMCLARHVPQAHQSMKEGKWARKDYMGEEVNGKTLAIIGLGRIGLEVAKRMQVFGMKTVGYDPIMNAENAAKHGVDWMQLDDIWSVADYVTVHVPLLPSTENLVCSQTLAKCKTGVKVINVARGGIINEADLLKALNDGKCGGAAFDVYLQEPPADRSLVEHPKVVCTPHLGASTLEAQSRVAVEIAENIVALNKKTGVLGALNGKALGF